MSQPDDVLIEFFKTLQGDLMILGIGGKIGTELGILAVNAIKASGVDRRVYGVSRFSRDGSDAFLKENGIETIRCDLQDREQVEALPEVENIIFLAGKKFGSTDNIEETWGMNVIVPHIVAERFSRSRMVIYSSGNIYAFVDRGSGGSLEKQLMVKETASRAMRPLTINDGAHASGLVWS
ncbi:MAG TPA: NAD(P)-dependent oxidoreductase [Fastidiosipila sp.]|nr:NAD(P)-dependent oxidoreductase [Fastidiosipila sp.]